MSPEEQQKLLTAVRDTARRAAEAIEARDQAIRVAFEAKVSRVRIAEAAQLSRERVYQIGNTPNDESV
ncbi:hypothetical protein AWN90_02825 [Nocardia terpenica]|uniref:Uncharacterized protein n=1 Tax=Nocardia terpenica TaxID=455432 RepID=A0A164KS16_9NOCA|nr:hypothetical protein AWN90_02825 [Nocardia terpenica]